MPPVEKIWRGARLENLIAQTVVDSDNEENLEALKDYAQSLKTIFSSDGFKNPDSEAFEHLTNGRPVEPGIGKPRLRLREFIGWCCTEDGWGCTIATDFTSVRELVAQARLDDIKKYNPLEPVISGKQNLSELFVSFDNTLKLQDSNRDQTKPREVFQNIRLFFSL